MGNIIRWLHDNTPWFFEGLGAGLILILVNFLFSRISKDKLNSEISNDVNSGKNQLTLNQSSGNVINQTNNISNQNNALTEQTIEVTQKSGNPTPEEIGVNLSKHKPFDKEKIKENYKNIKVSWVLKFHSLSIINEKRVRIAATEVDFKNKLHSLPVAIFFDIDISNQPEIKLMNKGEGILVSGEIEKASEFDIDLKNCTIKII